MKHCRDCDFSRPVGQWQLVCGGDWFTKPKWSQSAEAIEGCPYKNKDEARRELSETGRNKNRISA